MSNLLAEESSPYLLQHAHNPVHWLPWGQAAWDLAKTENKLVIISIGYSACHWCHVMAHESFEDEEVAALMNKDYICIKVDREERPDVDQFYMDAAQIMSGRGGWPLNAFALPDGRPVYAGTYFPKTSWKGLLHELASGYKYRTKQYLEYADKMLSGIKGLNPIYHSLPDESFPDHITERVYQSFAQLFDKTHGGKGRAPKFPMPDNYLFLLRYHHYYSKNEDALNHTVFTLKKMAAGGIYDQIGGGFARYATDAAWKIPHFEKMLYDNAQLLALYAEGFLITQDKRFKKVVEQTFDFLKRELHGEAFYSALDADSEGEEGKYYVWSDNELELILGELAPVAKALYEVGGKGYWENGNSILLFNDEIEASEHTQNIIEEKLLSARGQRIRPGLDAKILCSWNAMLISAFVKAYNCLQDEKYLKEAEQLYSFIIAKLNQDGKLFHTLKKDLPSISAFLEDYAFVIQAQIDLYSATFNEDYIQAAIKYTEFVLENFIDEQGVYFYFTSKENNDLLSRKIDLGDNVISSANSVMANNLFILGKLTDKDAYLSQSRKMLMGVLENLVEHGSYYSNWGMLLLKFNFPYYERAIVGERAKEIRKQFAHKFSPDTLIFGTTTKQSNIPLLEGKYVNGKTLVYLCADKTCGLPEEF